MREIVETSATGTRAGAITMRVGTQGWNYDAWLGAFYPVGTRTIDVLPVYGRAFHTVEVDSTFYAVPPRSTVRGWYDRTPGDFILALKLPQEITHDGRLRDAAGTTELFFDRVRELGDKLGPVLVQLPPDFGPDEQPALEAFLPRLPRDVRVAVEFRHRGWLIPGVLSTLRAHGVALALVDGPWIPRRWMLELARQPTADFHYVRWMGPDRVLVDHSHVQVDRSRELAQWSDALAAAPDTVGQVFAYASNFFAGHAPATARDMQALLGIEPVPPAVLSEQISLF